MVYVLSKEDLLILKVFLVGILQGSHIEIKLVSVRRTVIEGERCRWRSWFTFALSESLVKPEAMRQHKRAVVVGIVPQVIVGYRCLRRNRHKSGVSIDHAGGSEKPRL